MNFTFVHNNINVLDLEKSLAFYQQALHKQMDCICYENDKMGLYFIEDPDGYWIEIMPVRDDHA
jgi:lactoylglutathione lyase